MGGVAILVEALSRGGKVDWTVPDRPRLQVPKGIRVAIEAEIEDIREVLGRATIFKRQLSNNGPFHLMILPETKNITGGCISCGTEISANRIRCSLCQTAAWIALGLTPPSFKIEPEKDSLIQEKSEKHKENDSGNR